MLFYLKYLLVERNLKDHYLFLPSNFAVDAPQCKKQDRESWNTIPFTLSRFIICRTLSLFFKIRVLCFFWKWWSKLAIIGSTILNAIVVCHSLWFHVIVFQVTLIAQDVVPLFIVMTVLRLEEQYFLLPYWPRFLWVLMFLWMLLSFLSALSRCIVIALNSVFFYKNSLFSLSLLYLSFL